MSFHTSSSNIRVDDGHILRATLRNDNGEEVDSELDLNSCLSNSNGRFAWDGADFSESAEDISFTLEGDAQVPILRARLRGSDETYDADVNLAERIANNNGSLSFGRFLDFQLEYRAGRDQLTVHAV
ncbi:cyanovirin-N protein [Beauveria bassiana ARSEF 2860]|uniref:Cyanovirin-N protein n=1 Tax=Beauveria bassiana (strain ARSEF 2860) TaxID=655819 RepID=J5JAT7_BEAB2|nr:cyanovirin-N protein [Beauveria bassiana ARSEF 2860]EJP63248.1 cyanovirin-N protein [Beauveria bassiana ARSEF 2860]